MLHHQRSYRSLNSWLLPLCKRLSSSTRCDAVSVSSQLDTYIAEVQAGSTLSVNALEFWHARGPSGLARLVKDLICAPALQAYVERIFFACGLLYYGRRSSMFRSLEMRVCLKLNQIKFWKKPPVHSNRLSETWCYYANDLHRNSLAQQN